MFQLIFYLPNCGPNQNKIHENDTILIGIGENYENIYLGVDSNVFTYKLEYDFIVIHEAYQAGY